MPKAKPPNPRKKRQSIRTSRAETVPPVSHDRRKRADEADTLPPPPPDAEPEPRLSGRVKKQKLRAATVDEVTADLSKDPRREE
jgi:hypothetical protein